MGSSDEQHGLRAPPGWSGADPTAAHQLLLLHPAPSISLHCCCSLINLSSPTWLSIYSWEPTLQHPLYTLCLSFHMVSVPWVRHEDDDHFLSTRPMSPAPNRQALRVKRGTPTSGGLSICPMKGPPTKKKTPKETQRTWADYTPQPQACLSSQAPLPCHFILVPCCASEASQWLRATLPGSPSLPSRHLLPLMPAAYRQRLM